MKTNLQIKGRWILTLILALVLSFPGKPSPLLSEKEASFLLLTRFAENRLHAPITFPGPDPQDKNRKNRSNQTNSNQGGNSSGTGDNSQTDQSGGNNDSRDQGNSSNQDDSGAGTGDNSQTDQSGGNNDSGDQGNSSNQDDSGAGTGDNSQTDQSGGNNDSGDQGNSSNQNDSGAGTGDNSQTDQSGGNNGSGSGVNTNNQGNSGSGTGDNNNPTRPGATTGSGSQGNTTTTGNDGSGTGENSQTYMNRLTPDYAHAKWTGSLSMTESMESGANESLLSALTPGGEYDLSKNWKIKVTFRYSDRYLGYELFTVEKAVLISFNDNLSQTMFNMEREGHVVKGTSEEQAEASGRPLNSDEISLKLAVDPANGKYWIKGYINVEGIPVKGTDEMEIKVKPIDSEIDEDTENTTGIDEDVDVSGTFKSLPDFSFPSDLFGKKDFLQEVPEEFREFLEDLGGKQTKVMRWTFRRTSDRLP